jgi:hypothetical protein
MRSVKRIAQEGPVMQVDDGVERAQRQIGRWSGNSGKVFLRSAAIAVI